MKKKTIVSKIGILAVIMALSMSALTGCGNRGGDRTSDEVSSEESADTADGASGQCGRGVCIF